MAQPNAATQSATATPSFASINGFVGIYEGNNVSANGYELEPPDQGLAVNNNVAVEIVNNVLQIFNATTGAALTAPVATSVFFQAPSGTSLTDTQVFFDPTVQRWFLTQLIINETTIEDIGVAVSETSSATGSYYIYHIRAFSNDLSGCGTNDCLPDYPKAGYDANVFIIDVDLFSTAAGGNFVAAAGYVLPKSVLITGGGFTYTRLTFPNDFVVQPSIPAPGEPFVTAANGTEYLMESVGSNTVRVWAVSNTANIVSSPSSVRAISVDVGVQSFGNGTVPSTQPNVIGPYCASKGVTSAPQLDGGYSAFQATIQKASGRLYGALAFGAQDGNGLNRDVIAWFALTPSVNSSGVPSASVYQQGYVVPTNGYSLSYPAFGLNGTGYGVMGFTQTNQSSGVVGGYPSASIIEFTGSAITGNILVTGQGSTSDDGFSGCPGAGPGQVGRWGDYGAAVVDAATGYFYTGNEMIPNASSYPRGTLANWGTFITQSVPGGSGGPAPPVAVNPYSPVLCQFVEVSWTPDNPLPTGYYFDIAFDSGFTNLFYNNFQVAQANAAGYSLGNVFAPNTTYYYRVRAYNSNGVSGNSNTISVHTPLAAAHDYNCDGKSDILWRDTSGNVALWEMNGAQIGASSGLGNVPPSIWSIVGQRGFVSGTGGAAQILWHDTSGDVAIWYSGGVASVPTQWSIYGTSDLNGDHVGDLLWRDTSGNTAIWYMNGATIASTASLGNVPTNWTIVGDDSTGRIYWHDNAGDYAVWQISGGEMTASAGLGNVPLATWHLIGLGDFNGDGIVDLLWHDNSGNTAMWFLNSSLGVLSTAGLGTIPTNWSIAQIGDYNGDGKADILWLDTSGNVAIWFMNGGQIISTAGLGNVGTAWQVQSINSE